MSPGPRLRRLGIALAIPLLALEPATPRAAGSEAASPATPGVELSAVLDRMNRAALLYRQAALKFSCRETLHGDSGKVYRFEYLYVVDEDGKFHDYRTRVGDSQAVTITPESVPVKRWMSQAYSWVFQFQEDRWPHVRFRIAGTEQSRGRDVVLLAFEPIPPIDPAINSWTGTAWMEASTGRLVRVEAKAAEDLARVRSAEEDLAGAGGAKPAAPLRLPVQSVTTEFGIEKNGMLLPSKATVEVEEHVVPGRGDRASSARVVYRTFQTYDGYRFFGVMSEEKRTRP